jgi:DNA-binding NtrC family response regulator
METRPNLGHVLVLEDEPFISLDLEDMLRKPGATSVTVFDNRAAAIDWLATNCPDLAIIDPRLNDGICTDVVEKLTEARVPFVVYAGAEVDEQAFQKGEWLDKPTMSDILEESLERLLC